MTNCSFLRLIFYPYFSSLPKILSENLQRLSCPISSKFKGEPFSVVKAALVDLFPHTGHVELVLLLKRKRLAQEWLKAREEKETREGLVGGMKRAGEEQRTGSGPPKKRQRVVKGEKGQEEGGTEAGGSKEKEGNAKMVE